MAIPMDLVSKIVTALQADVKQLPERFYTSFDYTKTRRTYTHPITIGLLTKILWTFPEVGYVGVDVRLNAKDVKFQPDLVVFDRSLTSELLYADYESPNSCDTRIPRKDIAAYQAWRAATHGTAPYLLITTLPTSDSPDWRLRYAAKGKGNHPFKQKLVEIRQNPFKFWYSHYADRIQPNQLENVYFINIDGRRVRRVNSSEFAPGGLARRCSEPAMGISVL